MVHSELVAYITEQTKEGMSADLLRQELLGAGWRELDIDNAMHDVAAGLQPISIDASLHEDLAQVRGMVAHLASRLRVVETRLTGTTLPLALSAGPQALSQQEQLPAPVRGVRFGQWSMSVVALISFFVLNQFSDKLIAWASVAPQDQVILSVAIGFASLIVGYMMLQIHRARSAVVCAGIAVGIWGLTTRVAWQTYQAMEWSTALGLAGFLVVFSVVVGRWIHRSVR